VFERCLIKAVHSDTLVTNSELFKLVEPLLWVYWCFFTHRIKLRYVHFRARGDYVPFRHQQSLSRCIACQQWRTQKIFMGGFIQWHRIVISIWCALIVTSQFDVIVLFPNQRFGEVCW